MNQEYETKLRQNLLIQRELRKAGFPAKSFNQIEDETISDCNDFYDVLIYTCDCGIEYGEDEKTELTQCHYCGKTMCPDCSGRHGKSMVNQRYGICKKK